MNGSGDASRLPFYALTALMSLWFSNTKGWTSKCRGYNYSAVIVKEDMEDWGNESLLMAADVWSRSWYHGDAFRDLIAIHLSAYRRDKDLCYRWYSTEHDVFQSLRIWESTWKSFGFRHQELDVLCKTYIPIAWEGCCRLSIWLLLGQWREMII